VKSTLTTFEPSSATSGGASDAGASFSAISCCSASSSAALAWKLDRGVVELGDCGERHVEGRSDPAEGQSDAERILLDLQIPETVLDDDGHLVRETFNQVLGDRDSGSTRAEGDVEMVVAGQAARTLDLTKHTADNCAQGVLHDLVVRDQAFRSLVGHGLCGSGPGRPVKKSPVKRSSGDANRCDQTL